MTVSKRELMGLSSELALNTGHADVVDAASHLYALLKTQEVSLSMAEKLKVLKSVTKAKVRAFMRGPEDDYKTFKTLDTISNDLVQLL
ncbi:MAG TPA: hypothetical protein VLD37_07530 [Candidatus Bilamarchaeum sp.]|nr:hypothetical protein [Candidatus Bilamarchaeum sp.]